MTRILFCFSLAGCGLLSAVQEAPDVVRLPADELHITTEPQGDNCPQGGLRLTRSRDSVVRSTIFICSPELATLGPDGSIGASGAPGAEARLLLSPSTTCPGTKIVTGIDLNDNDMLDANEVAHEDVVCDGATGDTGMMGNAGEPGGGSNTGLSLAIERIGTCANGAGGVRITASVGGVEVTTRELCDGLTSGGGSGTGGTNQTGLDINAAPFDASVLSDFVGSVGSFGESIYTFTTRALPAITAPYTIDFVGLDGDVVVTVESGGAHAVLCEWVEAGHKACATEPLAPGVEAEVHVVDTSNLGSVFFLSVSFGGARGTSSSPRALTLGNFTGSVRGQGSEPWRFVAPSSGTFSFQVDDVQGVGAAFPQLQLILGNAGCSSLGALPLVCVMTGLVSGQPYDVLIFDQLPEGLTYALHVTAGDAVPQALVDGAGVTAPLVRFTAPGDGGVTVLLTTESFSGFSVYDDPQASALTSGCQRPGCVFTGLTPGKSYYVASVGTVRVIDDTTGDTPGAPVALPATIAGYVAELGSSGYAFNAGAGGRHTLRVQGAVADVEISIFADAALTQLIARQAQSADMLTVENLVSGTTYYAAVRGFFDQATPFTLDIAAGDPFHDVWADGPLSLAPNESRWFRINDADGGPFRLLVSNVSAPPNEAFLLRTQVFRNTSDAAPSMTCDGPCTSEYRTLASPGGFVRVQNSSGTDTKSADIAIELPMYTTLALYAAPVVTTLAPGERAFFKATAPSTGGYRLRLNCSAGCGAGYDLTYEAIAEGGINGDSGGGVFTQLNLPASGVMTAGAPYHVSMLNSGTTMLTFNIVWEVQ